MVKAKLVRGGRSKLRVAQGDDAVVPAFPKRILEDSPLADYDVLKFNWVPGVLVS